MFYLALDLLAKLLKFDPAERISAAEALSHPYFKATSAPYGTNPAPGSMAPPSFNYPHPHGAHASHQQQQQQQQRQPSQLPNQGTYPMYGQQAQSQPTTANTQPHVQPHPGMLIDPRLQHTQAPPLHGNSMQVDPRAPGMYNAQFGGPYGHGGR